MRGSHTAAPRGPGYLPPPKNLVSSVGVRGGGGRSPHASCHPRPRDAHAQVVRTVIRRHRQVPVRRGGRLDAPWRWCSFPRAKRGTSPGRLPRRRHRWFGDHAAAACGDGGASWGLIRRGLMRNGRLRNLYPSAEPPRLSGCVVPVTTPAQLASRSADCSGGGCGPRKDRGTPRASLPPRMRRRKHVGHGGARLVPRHCRVVQR